MLAWSESLSVHNTEIDNQHKELIVKLNDYLNAYDDKKPKEKLSEMFKYLSDYTKEHFSSEEKLMIKYKYPGYDYQKGQHTHFINELKSFQQEFSEKSSNLTLMIKTNHLIVDWLVNHIGKTDKAFGEYLQNR
jgi:hemerythrin